MDGTVAVEITGLRKSFGEINAVDGLNFTVFQGDIFGILGANGSGKSTTIRMLLTLVRPDKGEISILGRKLENHHRWIKQRTGALIERPDFYNYLTASKNLEILMKYSGMEAMGSRISEVLEMVGLLRFRDKKVGIFSQGMKQRLGIAQAIIHDPELIILDEPANGLDPRGMVDIRNLIVALNKEFGKTIVLSSHILREVELIANRTVIIHDGRNIAEGKVKDLLFGFENKIKILLDDIKRGYEVIKESGIEVPMEMCEDYLLLTVKQEEIPGINRLLNEKGLLVSGIIPVKSLEEYFLSLT